VWREAIDRFEIAELVRSSIEYLIGNMNKKVAAILLRFVKVANQSLNITV